jgi:hypothetical protein
MIGLARQAYPSLRFTVGSMTALDLGDGELGGILLGSPRTTRRRSTCR